MPKDASLSVIVPACNEEENIPLIYARLSAMAPRLKRPVEIILVDDGSTDGTWLSIREICRQDPMVRGLRFRSNRGKSAALAAGVQASSGEILVTIDADFQEDPEEMTTLLSELDEGFDLVSGWRRRRHDPFSKVFSSRLFNALVRLLTGTSLQDVNCGFKACRREVLTGLDLFGELHRVIPILAAHRGFRVGEVAVAHHARQHGRTKFKGLARGLHGILDLLTVQFLTHYQKRPLHFFGIVGIAAFLTGSAINLFLSVRYFLGLQFIGERLPLLMLGILLMILGFQAFGMGLLGEIVIRSVPQRPFVKPDEEVP